MRKMLRKPFVGSRQKKLLKQENVSQKNMKIEMKKNIISYKV